MTAESQELRIQRYLAAGNTLTPFQAFQLFGTMRLGARIHDLREKRKRWKIVTTMVSVGRNRRVARYSMVTK